MRLLTKLVEIKMKFQLLFKHPEYIEIYNIKIKLDYTRKLNAYVYSRFRYEVKPLQKFSDIIKKGDIIYDCGADQGLYSLIAGKKTGETGKVIAVEPIDSRMKKMKENILLNNLSNITTLSNLISDRSEEVDFDEGNTRVNFDEGNTRGIKRNSLTIDQIGEKYGFADIIKFDIEGHERLAFECMKKTFKKKPKLFIEIHPWYPTGPKGSMELIKILENEGYTIIHLEKGEKITSGTKNLIEKLYKRKNEMPHLYAEYGKK